MGKLFCLMGKSSSGKDTIFKVLKEDLELNLKPVILYTTRPKRSDETDGVEYFFITEKLLKEYALAEKIIEKREYNTTKGKWYYCTIDDGQIDLSKHNYILIVTLEAYKSLQNYYGEDKIIPLYIEVEDRIRLERALERERRQLKPDYNELCRRFLADNIDFSEARLTEHNINKYYNNDCLESCVNEIKKEIQNSLGCYN